MVEASKQGGCGPGAVGGLFLVGRAAPVGPHQPPEKLWASLCQRPSPDSYQAIHTPPDRPEWGPRAVSPGPVFLTRGRSLATEAGPPPSAHFM